MMRALFRCAKTIAGVVHSPADALLFVQICAFIVRLPAIVRRTDVPTFFERIGTAPRPKARSFEAGYRRVARLREAALSMPRLWRRDTCYLRAVTLYRFLDSRGHRVRVHFGVEQSSSPEQRLRGHAWISVDDALFEAPDAVRLRRIHEVPLHVAI
jgi:Transglutaminase-like superfamily